jgi:peptide/nickel transport system substrate-binding protein
VQGSLFVYQKFDQYQPRDAATKAAAMQAGEMDWWENPPADLLPLLRTANIQTAITDHTGNPFILRPNHLHPPFRQACRTPGNDGRH